MNNLDTNEKQKLMETLTNKLERLNSLIKDKNSEVIRMINISAETELSMRNNDTKRQAIAEKKIERILKNINKPRRIK
ncbi:MAG: hypothetical protein KDC42_01535 [Ignavibacteriae bacterium]|nr:hypothetical protein [Ignavibacteriota bacterium]